MPAGISAETTRDEQKPKNGVLPAKQAGLLKRQAPTVNSIVQARRTVAISAAWDSQPSLS
jgi:hypothetical protein